MSRVSRVVTILSAVWLGSAPDAHAVDLPVTDQPGLWQGIVNNNPAGTTYTIKATDAGGVVGPSRLQTVTAKSGDTFVGENGAMMKGSGILDPTNLLSDNDASHPPSTFYWNVPGLNTSGTYDSASQNAAPGWERAVYYSNDLFVNGKRQRHLNAISDLNADDECYMDRATGRVYVHGDKSGKFVEISLTPNAFLLGTTTGVTIRNLAVYQYADASRPIHTIDGSDSVETLIDRVDASYNHAAGLGVGKEMTIKNSRFAFNGQLGLRGSGGDEAPLFLEDNELANNNALHFDNVEEGAMKISHSIGGHFKNSWVHDNLQQGLWYDVSNVSVKIFSNLIEGTATNRGIYYEIGGDHEAPPTEIYWNQVRDSNDTGIAVRASENIKIYGNAVINTMSVGKGIYVWDYSQSPGIGDISVYDNQVSMLGNAKHIRLNYEFPSDILRVSGNRYFGTNQWSILNVTKTWAQWQAYTYGSPATGYDTAASGASFTPSTTPIEPSLPAGATKFAYSSYGPSGYKRMLQAHLDEHRGTQARDLSGNGLAGTISNGAVHDPDGYLSYGVTFDGIDDGIVFGHSPTLDTTDDKVTLMAWVNPSNLSGGRAIVGKYSSYDLSLNNGKPRLQLRLVGGATFIAETTNTPVTTGSWSHVAAVRSGNTVVIYVNGVPQPLTLTGASSASIEPNTSALVIGRRNNNTQPFAGQIDEVEVYNRALSRKDIQMAMK